jgi:hypothetical protein
MSGRPLRDVEDHLILVMIANQRVLRVTEVPWAHRFLLDPFGHHDLKLILETRAEEQTNQAAFLVRCFRAVYRTIGHTPAKQRPQSLRRNRIAAGICAPDVRAEWATVACVSSEKSKLARGSSPDVLASGRHLA